MKVKPFLLAFLIGGSTVFSLRADTIYLNNGSEVNGTIVEENANTIAVKRANGTITSVRRSDIEAIVYDRKKDEGGLKTTARRTEVKPPEPKAAESKPLDTKPAPATTDVKPAVPATAEAKPETAATPEKPATPAAETKPATGEPKLTADVTKTETKQDPPKPDAPKAEAPRTAAKPEEKKPEPGKKDEAKKEEWTPPPGLPAFPEKAKRMSKEKEEQFMSALARLATTEEAPRVAAKNEIAAMGPDVLPYVVAGINHVNVEARSSCMSLIGQLNGRTAVKQVIEVFYSVMPEKDAAPSWQVPFVRAIKETLPTITGQSFISVQPDKALVNDGLKKYIAWYTENFDRLPKQLGEPEIEPTDPDYAKKLKEARSLKLVKKDWPRPPMPAEMVGGKPPPPASASERPADRALRDSVPTISRDEVGKRR
ncbi:MAG TPA: hypothetical protein VEK08_20470 [Planctomycetota bacterium]|nr:hypothetical protein [Planctomycetota bacterium]